MKGARFATETITSGFNHLFANLVRMTIAYLFCSFEYTRTRAIEHTSIYTQKAAHPPLHTYTYTHTHIYIYVRVRVCVCVSACVSK